MKKRITGAITFFLGIITIMFAMNILLKKGSYLDAEDIFFYLLIGIGGVSALLYIYWTHFGGDPENSKVERENKLLKSKIEQKKLRKELEED